MTIESVGITTGSGALVAVDIVSGSAIEYLKLIDGTKGSTEVITGTTAYGLKTDVSRLPTVVLDSGSSVIGVVNVSGSVSTGLEQGLTDTQLRASAVDTNMNNWSKASTLNSGSGTFSGSSDGSIPIWTGTFEVVDDYGELFVSVNMPDATENLMIIIEESINGSDVYDTSLYAVSTEQCKLNASITYRYLRVTVYCVVGAGDHNYDVVTVFKKKGLQSFPYVLDPSGNNTRLHEDGSGRLLTMITPDGDLWAYLGSREDARSTATDTTATSLMSVTKEISYMAQNPANQPIFFSGSTPVLTTIISGSLPVHGVYLSGSMPVLVVNVSGSVQLGAGSNTIGSVISSGSVYLGTGANAIGKLAANVGVNIGDVRVTGSALLGPGTSVIGSVISSGSVLLGAGTNAIGKLAANAGVNIGDIRVTGSALLGPGTSTIGSVITSGSVLLGSGTSLVGKVSSGNDTSTIYNGTTALIPKFVSISASISGNNQLIAGVAGKKLRVLNMMLMSASIVNMKFQSGAGGTDLSGLLPMQQSIGFVLPYSPVGWYETSASATLNLNTSAAVVVTGFATYVEV